MRRCLQRTFLRNDALRLRFVLRDGEFGQQVGTDVPEVEFVDFTAIPTPKGRACAGSTKRASTCLGLRDR